MNPAVRNYARLGSQAVSVVTVARQLRNAKTDKDGLRLLDAVVNILAIATAVALIVRELRRRGDDDVSDAVETAKL